MGWAVSAAAKADNAITTETCGPGERSVGRKRRLLTICIQRFARIAAPKDFQPAASARRNSIGGPLLINRAFRPSARA